MVGGGDREKGTPACQNCGEEGRGVTCFRDSDEGFPESREKGEGRGEQKAYTEDREGGGVVQGALHQVSRGWSQDRVQGGGGVGAGWGLSIGN